MPMIVGPMSLSTFMVPGFENVFLSEVNVRCQSFLSTNGTWNSACTSPPIMTPIAIARAGFAAYGARRYVHRMTSPLKRIGVNPDGEKILSPLRIPWSKAEIEIITRYGNMMRVSMEHSFISSIWSARYQMRRICGVKIMPSETNTTVRKVTSVNVALTDRKSVV